MFKKLFACALVAGILGLSAQEALAQDLGPFPVDRRRDAPEKDGLIRNARLTSTGFGFLKLTTNARSVGMGDAFSAVGNDVTSIFSNPAGITQMETERAAMGGYTKWIIGSTLGTAAFAVKTGVATFGVSAIFFSSETFEETTSQNPAGTGRMVNTSDVAIGFTVAKQLTDKLSFGGQVRWIKEDLILKDFSTVDVSFGTVFFTGYKSTRLSMSLRNLGADATVVAMDARVPTVFYLAAAGEIYGNLGDPFSLTASAEQAFFTDYEARYYVGGEAWIQNAFALRAGYKSGHTNESWSVGAGLKHEMGGQRIGVDVSLSNAETLEENPIRLTVSYGF
ncbi:MAG: hypothetical protein CME19_25170 [Gemmatimonadetes bacterium]|nr:hypothetical protein [Gemmatimonadota bacterium]